jgi:hypothetical protein
VKALRLAKDYRITTGIKDVLTAARYGKWGINYPLAVMADGMVYTNYA